MRQLPFALRGSCSQCLDPGGASVSYNTRPATPMKNQEEKLSPLEPHPHRGYSACAHQPMLSAHRVHTYRVKRAGLVVQMRIARSATEHFNAMRTSAKHPLPHHVL
mmetsp:Transcript_17857/g.28310  ORF Transcript_17857/g.28310 Transcript_17857/m.28310 type:complete len:106 (+) Transcript_17857:222-539(+)